jgi:hypothetical protein
MKETLAVIGALSAGVTFIVIVLVILGTMQERADRKARAREQHSAEQLEHVRRFSAVQAVLDLDAYRARKANAPATGVQAPSLGASHGRLESQPEVQQSYSGMPVSDCAGMLTSSAQGGQAS